MATRTEQAARTALAAAIGTEHLRDAGQADTVGGVQPRWVASVDGTEQTAAAMRVAAEHGLRVTARGAGSKIDWGGTVEAVDLVLDLSRASEICEHAAGDLVLRARAGTSLAEVQRVAAEAGQQLSIDQPFPEATVGGVIATGTTGPGRHLFGAVRDLLIGITVVRADGVVTTSGGKVVKNVAGYDLGKLYTGSYGTLGVITEAIFRLHPLAAEHRWVAVTLSDPGAAGEAVHTVRSSQAMPTAVETDRAEPDGPITVCAHLEGRPQATHRRARELAERLDATVGVSGEVLDAAPPWWGRYPFGNAWGTGLRLGAEPAAIGSLLAGVQQAADHRDLPLAVRGSAGLGVLHAGVPDSADPAAVADLVRELRAVTTEYGGHAVVLRAPEAVRATVDPWGPIAEGELTLMHRTKDQFDPEHRLSPGRFVGGI
ncbi:glycolate oxidase FAD binding subunit [Halopolyspora algeriensis]|uniref:Glycolate oxidase FAD binding subunit n=1 Tax=Halopolyspora algeriensis TaxID=1500506 RepID=A0A368VVI1_9ACTN|nr:FAD-binding oxidoreductase [Halopolyspora algeriensis]RCW45296.1 glycolate oxidase FAD binding subunit [Halopolyspora algeriensis]TQM47336.1 glycolate oxidase FAD binding subunit [Halopolyspora algeriensis]